MSPYAEKGATGYGAGFKKMSLSEGAGLSTAILRYWHCSKPVTLTAELQAYADYYVEHNAYRKTYNLSIYIMIAEKIGPSAKHHMRDALQALINGQKYYGDWNYWSDTIRKGTEQSDAGPMIRVTTGNDKGGGGSLVEQTLIPDAESAKRRIDTSMLQYAVLAAARNAYLAGFEIEDHHWQRIRDLLIHYQGPNGGWAYRGKGRETGDNDVSCTGVVIAEVLPRPRKPPPR